MGLARATFDALTAPGSEAERWARIEKLVADREEESLWLDFKEVLPGAAPTNDYLKEKLARSLSGFANTEGGILIYGIVAQGGKKGLPDTAERIVDIKDVASFRLGLEKLAVVVTDPIISGIIATAIIRPGTSDGVVIVYVPESVGAPHRVVGSTSAVNDRYMMRTVTGFFVMPHRLLADRFARSAPPSLQLSATITNLSNFMIAFRLKNVGRGAARRPAFQVLNVPYALAPEATDSAQATGFMVRVNEAADGAKHLLVEPFNDVTIYPGMELKVASIHARGLVPMELQVFLYALDMQPIAGTVKLNLEAATLGKTYDMEINGS